MEGRDVEQPGSSETSESNKANEILIGVEGDNSESLKIHIGRTCCKGIETATETVKRSVVISATCRECGEPCAHLDEVMGKTASYLEGEALRKSVNL